MHTRTYKWYYMDEEKKNPIKQTSNISINGLAVSTESDEEYYRYLGVDEYTSSNGTCNKSQVTEEYFN